MCLSSSRRFTTDRTLLFGRPFASLLPGLFRQRLVRYRVATFTLQSLRGRARTLHAHAMLRLGLAAQVIALGMKSRFF